MQDTNKTFDKNTIIYKRFRNAFGDGLVVAEGERWKRQRKLLQPMFGQLAVERYFDIMVDAANALADGWDQSSKYRGPFDVAKEMNDVTLEIAGRSLFHDGFDQARDRIGHWTETINRYSAKPPLPIVRSFWFPSRRNRMLKQTLREFHEFLSAMIANRRPGQRKEDLLGVLLHATHDESGRTMTDQEIVEVVSNDRVDVLNTEVAIDSVQFLTAWLGLLIAASQYVPIKQRLDLHVPQK